MKPVVVTDKYLAELTVTMQEAGKAILALTSRIQELEAQIEWHPMSDGLPTEEGVTYEFLRWDRDHIRMFTRDTSVTVNWPWQPVDRDDLSAGDDEMTTEFTHWRRVTLPEKVT